MKRLLVLISWICIILFFTGGFGGGMPLSVAIIISTITASSFSVGYFSALITEAHSDRKLNENDLE